MNSSSSYAVFHHSYDLVVVGGGSGGCAAAAKFSAKLGKGKVAVIDPAEVIFQYSNSYRAVFIKKLENVLLFS